MDPNTFPTKGNLIAAKNSLGLAYMGYGLMDKKRNILIRELMELIDEAKGIQSEIDSTFRAAYAALQKANIELGINYVQEIGASVPVDDRVKIKARSIMGTEIPLVQHESRPLALTYGFYNTTESLDEARYHFEKVKELTIKLSMVENSAYRLANSIKKTQKRANALKNITIPHYEDLSKSISCLLYTSLYMTGNPLPATVILVIMFLIPLLVIFFKEPLAAIVEKKAERMETGLGMFITQGIFELFEVLLSYFSNTLSFVRVGAFAVSHAAMMQVVLMLAGAEAGGNTNWAVVVGGNLFVCGMEGLIVGIDVYKRQGIWI